MLFVVDVMLPCSFVDASPTSPQLHPRMKAAREVPAMVTTSLCRAGGVTRVTFPFGSRPEVADAPGL